MTDDEIGAYIWNNKFLHELYCWECDNKHTTYFDDEGTCSHCTVPFENCPNIEEVRDDCEL